MSDISLRVVTENPHVRRGEPRLPLCNVFVCRAVIDRHTGLSIHIARYGNAASGRAAGLVFSRLFSWFCRPDFHGMGNKFFIHLHSVNHDSVADLDIGFLD